MQSGTVSLDGGYDLTNGTLNVGISSLTNYGVINFPGNAELAGTLSANLNNGYVPSMSNVFPIVTFASASGNFSYTNLPAFATWTASDPPTSFTLTFLQLIPVLTWTNPPDLVYGTPLGSAQFNATAASPVNLAESLPGTFTYNPPVGTGLFASNSQRLSVVFTPTDAVTYTNATTHVTINILKAPLTVAASNTNKTYGQTVTFPGNEFTTSGLKYSDRVTSVDLSSSGAAATAMVAGSPYVIAPSAAVGSGLVNYTINYTNGTLTVNPAPLTIIAQNRAKTYGQLVTFLGTEFNTSGLLNSDSVNSVTLTSSGTATNAAVAGSPYSIVPGSAEGSGLGNYAITYTVGQLTVDKAALTVTANAERKTYGQTLAFGNGSTRFDSSTLQNGETIGSVTLAVSGNGGAATASVAGSPYTITSSAATGGTFNVGNYAITYADGQLTVNSAPLTITSIAQSKTYGESLNLGTTAFTTTVLSNSDTVASVTLSSLGAAPTATVAGSPYIITASAPVGTGLGNYAITYANGALTVHTAALTITATNQSKYQGQTLTFTGLEFTTSGLQNLESIGSVTLSCDGAEADALVGSYTIIPANATGGTFAPSNYGISYQNGTLYVSALPALQFNAQGHLLVLSWATNVVGFSLQATTDLSSMTGWSPVSGGVVVGDQNVVTNTMSAPCAFYRLKQ